ncbi:crossover junction endodeoxyribonuclease RuvC [Brevibacillus agri]|uniref:crossover junction endodeoxyribonuclease RuvC n=1 Tax=Brevibacillus agri TaxID=51101 RepID=UPI003D190F13
MTFLISLDQSITTPGYSVCKIDDNQCCSLLQYGTIKLTKGMPYFERIISLEQILDQLLSDYPINIAVVEDIQKHRSASITTYKKLAYLHFFLTYYFFIRKIECHTIHANSWRSGLKKMIGVSKVKKSSVQQFYHTLLQQPSDFSTDKSDSLGLAIQMCTNVLQTKNIDLDNAISKT